MNQGEFQEALLEQMERKTHWAWPAFSQGKVAKDRLHIHLEQEYAVYVRDFPVLVARSYVQCGIPEVRRELIENVFEEETGALHAGRPHPELFLDYPRGLGMDLNRFEDIELLPAAARYRELIDDLTMHRGWAVSATISTLFIEGNCYERSVLDEQAEKRPEPALEDHPLVKHYGLPLDCLRLTKAHRQVEGDHRLSAWKVLLEHVPERDRKVCVDSLRSCVDAWHQYRDAVANACGMERKSTATQAHT
jgi:pyrroloquinoline-quinone synthase